MYSLYHFNFFCKGFYKKKYTFSKIFLAKKEILKSPQIYLYLFYIFKKRLIEIPDPSEPIKIPITNNKEIISGLNTSGEIIERF